jgi:hypothetical protein
MASALGLTRKSSSYCRQNSVPESRLGDLMRLARERGRGRDHRARAGLVGPTVRGVRRDDRSAHCPPPADVRNRRNPRWHVPGLADAARHGATMTDQLFEDAPVAVSLKRHLPSAEREVRLRRQAYPNRIATKRMSAAKAAEEITAMEVSAETLRGLIEERRRPAYGSFNAISTLGPTGSPRAGGYRGSWPPWLGRMAPTACSSPERMSHERLFRPR